MEKPISLSQFNLSSRYASYRLGLANPATITPLTIFPRDEPSFTLLAPSPDDLPVQVRYTASCMAILCRTSVLLLGHRTNTKCYSYPRDDYAQQHYSASTARHFLVDVKSR